MRGLQTSVRNRMYQAHACNTGVISHVTFECVHVSLPVPASTENCSMPPISHDEAASAFPPLRDPHSSLEDLVAMTKRASEENSCVWQYSQSAVVLLRVRLSRMILTGPFHPVLHTPTHDISSSLCYATDRSTAHRAQARSLVACTALHFDLERG
jgi:hypothetical protein